MKAKKKRRRTSLEIALMSRRGMASYHVRLALAFFATDGTNLLRDYREILAHALYIATSPASSNDDRHDRAARIRNLVHNSSCIEQSLRSLESQLRNAAGLLAPSAAEKKAAVSS